MANDESKHQRVAKKHIPHPETVPNDKHLEVAEHAMQQIRAGHYGIKDATQEDLGNGEARLSFTRFESDRSAPKAPHGIAGVPESAA